MQGLLPILTARQALHSTAIACAHLTHYSLAQVGNQVVQALENARAANMSDLPLRCLGPEDQATPLDELLPLMEHSRFCLILPGRPQATARLSEAFLAGGACLDCCESTCSDPAKGRQGCMRMRQSLVLLQCMSP